MTETVQSSSKQQTLSDSKNIRKLIPAREKTALRYAAVKERYAALRLIRVEGMSLKHGDIIDKIALEFFLSCNTIEHILARVD